MHEDTALLIAVALVFLGVPIAFLIADVLSRS